MYATLASRDVVNYLFHHPISFDLSLDIHSASTYVNYVYPTIVSNAVSKRGRGIAYEYWHVLYLDGANNSKQSGLSFSLFYSMS